MPDSSESESPEAELTETGSSGTAPTEPDSGATPSSDDGGTPGEVERLLDEAERSLEQATGDGGAADDHQRMSGHDPAADAKPYALGALEPGEVGEDADRPIDLIGEVEMDLRIELGRTQMRLDEVLRLRSGSVVTLDKLAGDPVDIFANGRLIARGEVLVMNDNFCIRVTELVGA